jgi:hypothetical protein
MKHFDNWQWADFVRGLGDTPTRSTMQSHLSGCGSCQKTADRLRAVAVEARADAEYAPPAPVLRTAQAIFAMNRPEKKVSLVRLVAQLVYDSAREPLAAGLRSQDRLSRRALYEAGDYHVDLQLEREPASGLITLVGQLAARRQATSITDVPVWLMERDSLVENTTCNAFGEFQLEYEPRRNLRLFLPLREAGKRMEIALDHLTPGGRTAMRGAAPVRKAPKRKSIKPA